MDEVQWRPTNPAVNPSSQYLSSAEYRARSDACTLYHLKQLPAGGIYRRHKQEPWRTLLLVSSLLTTLAASSLAAWQVVQAQVTRCIAMWADHWFTNHN